MKSLKSNEQGLIPLLLAVLTIVVIVIYVAFQRVSSAQ
jgi:hypothetical protein